MLSAVAYCHALLRQRLLPGDLALDATTGNGHDTHFLAQLIAPDGRVFGFDVQPAAIVATRLLLQHSGVPEACYELIQGSHATLAEHLPPLACGRLAAAVFNLGYLPGGDKSVITRADTTLPAVRAALDWLRPGGLLLLVLYPGHPGGAEEAQALRDFASSLPSRRWHVTEYRTLNARQAPPTVLALEKTSPESRMDRQI